MRVVAANPMPDSNGCVYANITSSLMPLFFLLSGFSMTIGYAGRLKMADEDQSSAMEPVVENPMSLEAPIASRGEVTVSKTPAPPSSRRLLMNYFYNRFLRVMPMYWLCLLLAVPPVFSGYGMQLPINHPGDIRNALIINIIPVMTWVGLFCPYPINGPEWTVQTLWFFWIAFPWLLNYYEKKSDVELLKGIRYMYNVQLTLVLAGTAMDIFTDLPGFAITSQTPYCRIFVFIMGIQAGLLCCRHPVIRGREEIPGQSQNHLPWFRCTGNLIPWRFFSCLGVDDTELIALTDFDSKLIAGSPLSPLSPVTTQSAKLLLSTILLGVVETVSMQVYGIYLDTELWFQGVNVFAQLDVLVGLTRLGGRSEASKVLRHPVWQWLGSISMAIYLVHWPLIYYLCWWRHGSAITFPDNTDCASLSAGSSERAVCDEWESANTMPYWGVAVVPPAAILLAAVLFYGVEEPIRKYFK
jgi:peptidoglycan/LPS O-acetylase OafA/YrhL